MSASRFLAPIAGSTYLGSKSNSSNNFPITLSPKTISTASKTYCMKVKENFIYSFHTFGRGDFNFLLTCYSKQQIQNLNFMNNIVFSFYIIGSIKLSVYIYYYNFSKNSCILIYLPHQKH